MERGDYDSRQNDEDLRDGYSNNDSNNRLVKVRSKSSITNTGGGTTASINILKPKIKLKNNVQENGGEPITMRKLIEM